MRLIDADALSEKLYKMTTFIKDGEKFQRMINDAPTIEPDGDTISRSQAIKDISEWATDILHPDRLIKEDAIHILESLPSAEQVTGKLNNPDDSLLTDDSNTCKESKSKLDLISRQDALAEFRDGRDVYDIMESIEALPSVQADGDTISRRDAILAITGEPPEAHYPSWYADRIKSLPSVQPSGDLISRQAVIELIKNSYYNLAENMDDVWAMVHDVEQLPSAPDSRQRGEWVRLEREENVYDLHGVPTWGVNYMCDKCGFITTAIQDHFAQYRWCPSCGARMYKGGEEE